MLPLTSCPILLSTLPSIDRSSPTRRRRSRSRSAPLRRPAACDCFGRCSTASARSTSWPTAQISHRAPLPNSSACSARADSSRCAASAATRTTASTTITSRTSSPPCAITTSTSTLRCHKPGRHRQKRATIGSRASRRCRRGPERIQRLALNAVEVIDLVKGGGSETRPKPPPAPCPRDRATRTPGRRRRGRCAQTWRGCAMPGLVCGGIRSRRDIRQASSLSSSGIGPAPVGGDSVVAR